MLSRLDFVFTIGYDGDTAIVDGRSKAKFGNLTTEQLARAGLFKQALASALHDESNEIAQKVLTIYNEGNPRPADDVEHLQRIFGVTRLPEGISKAKSF